MILYVYDVYNVYNHIYNVYDVYNVYNVYNVLNIPVFAVRVCNCFTFFNRAPLGCRTSARPVYTTIFTLYRQHFDPTSLLPLPSFSLSSSWGKG